MRGEPGGERAAGGEVAGLLEHSVGDRPDVVTGTTHVIAITIRSPAYPGMVPPNIDGYRSITWVPCHMG